jgi:hypothetical protein
MRCVVVTMASALWSCSLDWQTSPAADAIDGADASSRDTSDAGRESRDAGVFDGGTPSDDAGTTDPDCTASEATLCARATSRCATIEVEGCPTPRRVVCTPQPDEANGVFVAEHGQDMPPGATCGTARLPCKTVTRGIAVARLNERSVVHVGSGTFVEDGLTLSAGMTLVGGWSELGGDWTGLCGSDAPTKTVLMPQTSNITLRAEELGGTAHVKALTLRSREGDAAPGESFYGLHVTGATSRVELEQVHIEVRAGAVGAPGARGAEGVAQSSSCENGAAGPGAPGGPAPAAGPAGEFGSAGYQPAAGLAGLTGGVGEGGTVGANVECRNCQSHCSGGVSGPCWAGSQQNICAGAGKGGCGGGGGGGGEGGGGGGSSVALFAWDATVLAHRSTLRAGDGGQGGTGGEGGPGAAGAAGRRGDDVQCPSGSGVCVYMGGPCVPQPMTVPGGAAGGVGGTGGAGGPGGGGSGGHSYAAFRGGSSMLILEETSLEHGAAGAGGTGAVEGAAGAAAEVGESRSDVARGAQRSMRHW